MEEVSARITFTAQQLRGLRAEVVLPDESPLSVSIEKERSDTERMTSASRSTHAATSQSKKVTRADDGDWRAKGKPEFTKPPATVKRVEKSSEKAAGRPAKEPRKKDSLWDDTPPVGNTSRAEQERLLFERERAEFLANRTHAAAPAMDDTDILLEEERGSSILQLRDEDASPRSDHGGMKSMTVSQLLRRHSQNKDQPAPPQELPYPALDLAMLRHPPEITDDGDMKWLNDILDMPHDDMPMHESPRSGRREKSLLSHLSSDPAPMEPPSTPPLTSKHFPTNSNSNALTSFLGLGQKAAVSPGRDAGTRVAVSSLFSAASAQGGVMAVNEAAAPVIVSHTDVLSVLGFNAPPSPPRKDPPPAAASPSFVFHKTGGASSPAVDGSAKKPAISAASRLHIQRILQSSEKKKSSGDTKPAKPSPSSASKSAQLVAALSANSANPSNSSPAIVVSSVPPSTATSTNATKPGMKKINLNSIFSAAASAPNKTLQVGK